MTAARRVVRRGERVRIGEDGRGKLRRVLGSLVLRFHVSVILLATIVAGALANQGLLALGFELPMLRWPLGILAAYAVFFGSVRLWLAYVHGLHEEPGESAAVEAREREIAFPDELPEEEDDAGREPMITGKSVLEEPSTRLAKQAYLRVGGIELYLLGALVFGLVGSLVFFWVSGPAILVEVAFEGALAAGLLSPTRDAERPGWSGSLLQRTAVPFALAILAALVLGAVMHEFCPGAATLGDVPEECRSR